MPAADSGDHAPANRYRLYGRVCASSFDLPELERATTDDVVDFVVTRGSAGVPPDDSIVERIDDGRGDDWKTVSRAATSVWIHYATGPVYRADDVGSQTVTVVAEADPGVPEITLQHFLIDDVIPLLIAQAGVVVLHGAAIRVDDAALVVASESGSGKSTLATSFARAGYPLLADDCVVVDVLDDSFSAQPSYPSVRLWKRAARALLGDTGSGRAFAHYSEKLRYSDGLPFANARAPVKAIAVLHWPPEPPSCVSIEEIRGSRACIEILHSLRDLPSGHVRRAVAADVLSLADAVRVVRVTAPNDLSQVPIVRDVLVDWLRA